MDRRLVLRSIAKALLTGAALCATTSASAAALGLDKYAEVIRLQEDTLAIHNRLSRVIDPDALYPRREYAPHYGDMIAPSFDKVLGYSMSNFTGDLKSEEAVEATRRIFNEPGYCNTLDENQLRQILEAVVPIAIARQFLCHHRITFNPRDMKNWEEFSEKYSDLVLTA